jgi:hypothetical protein
MKLTLKSQSAQWLLTAGLVLGVASANAASGFTVTHEQEMRVTAGMTAGEVRQVIGSPLAIQKYGNEPGPTWSYRVAGAGVDPYDIVFDIDFGADGRVASVSEVEILDTGD